MARKFTRRRWRRPERMTLEAPPVSRRKHLGPPDILTLEPDLQRRTTKRRLRTMNAAFVAAAVVEGGIVGLLVHAWFIAVVALVLSAAYLGAAATFGGRWIRRALGAEAARNLRVNQFTGSLAAAAGIPRPDALVVRDAGMNAVAIDAGSTAIVVTTGSLNADDLVLEGMMAHEVAHLRDGDAAVASRYTLLTGAYELVRRVPPIVFGLPLWPASLVVRALARAWFSIDEEHRADVAGALLTRYPPGVASALRNAHGGTSPGPRAMARFWFSPRGDDRTRLIDEM